MCENLDRLALYQVEEEVVSVRGIIYVSMDGLSDLDDLALVRVIDRNDIVVCGDDEIPGG